MSDNLLQTLQQLVQDVIAPDVRELKVRMGAVEKQLDFFEKHMESRFAAVDQKFAAMDQKIDGLEKRMESRFAGMDQKSDLQFRAIMAAISESKMHSELTTVQIISALSERVAVLKSQRH